MAKKDAPKLTKTRIEELREMIQNGQIKAVPVPAIRELIELEANEKAKGKAKP